MNLKPVFIICFLVFFSCNNIGKNNTVANNHNCMPSNPYTIVDKNSTRDLEFETSSNNEGMVFINGGEFLMGADDDQAKDDEYPKHKVIVNSFWMDQTEVTNTDFKEFVDATGYITTAEKAIDWEEIKKILPTGTAKPNDSLLAPASLVFFECKTINMYDYTQWWKLKKNVNWRQPQGIGSSIKDKENHPVVHISWDDAIAYCKWSGKRLPTEAEFEYASRGGLENTIYSWGNEPAQKGNPKANTWEGKFPSDNNLNDNFYLTAPVKSFAPNSFGLYDLGGNVWEWCFDWYDSEYYKTISTKTSLNPQGPKDSYDPMEPYSPKKVMRGGSFLCNDSYCSGYRNSMRMKSTPDSSSQHAGFRTVVDVKS